MTFFSESDARMSILFQDTVAQYARTAKHKIQKHVTGARREAHQAEEESSLVNSRPELRQSRLILRMVSGE